MTAKLFEPIKLNLTYWLKLPYDRVHDESATENIFRLSFHEHLAGFEKNIYSCYSRTYFRYTIIINIHYVWMEANLCRVLFSSFVYICITVGDQVIKTESLDLINRFKPAILLCISQASPWPLTSYVAVITDSGYHV
jgi:hypothetical protein